MLLMYKDGVMNMAVFKTVLYEHSV